MIVKSTPWPEANIDHAGSQTFKKDTCQKKESRTLLSLNRRIKQKKLLPIENDFLQNESSMGVLLSRIIIIFTQW